MTLMPMTGRFAKKPELDWDYIIKNKCLCWFWDNKIEYGRYAHLNKVNKKNTQPYEDSYFDLWENCRPLCRDEVTFYEDKEDD